MVINIEENIKVIMWNCFAQLLRKYALKLCKMEASSGWEGLCE